MTVQFNHTIVWCRDNRASAEFLTDLLDLPAARPFLHFMVVELGNGVSLDFMAKTGDVAPQHYAFLVSDKQFDVSHRRIVASNIDYWADPGRTVPGEINYRFGGRGFYFQDGDGHLLELITDTDMTAAAA